MRKQRMCSVDFPLPNTKAKPVLKRYKYGFRTHDMSLSTLSTNYNQLHSTKLLPTLPIFKMKAFTFVLFFSASLALALPTEQAEQGTTQTRHIFTLNHITSYEHLLILSQLRHSRNAIAMNKSVAIGITPNAAI